MNFKCPRCFGPDTLEILDSIALPADSRSDEIALQIVGCGRCGLQGLAVYEESRRGSLFSESWEHNGYLVSEAEFEKIRSLIGICPDPENARCSCPAHHRLERRDANGRWKGLDAVKILGTFPLDGAGSA
jgi:hypothetical protein